MTISPFQNLILNALDMALIEGGYADTELYFEQLTPLVILAQTAEETGKSVGQVEDETNKSMENPATQDNPGDQTTAEVKPEEQLERYEYGLSSAFFKQNYETYKD
jgi:hypothetical protein